MHPDVWLLWVMPEARKEALGQIVDLSNKKTKKIVFMYFIYVYT